MADYRVNLDIFAGPLDLLLYLVHKEEVDIYDIPIAKITDQYIRYIDMLKSLDIDLAGDFLVMAATLMQIKSAMLLPKAEPEQLEADDFIDPRTELIRQLLEYKKFKDAANLLADAADEQRQRFPRPDILTEQLNAEPEPEIDMEKVSVWDLLEAFDSIMKTISPSVDISHIKDDTPIDLYQIEILHRLQIEGPMKFEQIFDSKANRVVMIGLFLALLELIREELVWAEQTGRSSDIYLRPLTDQPAEQAVQTAIIAISETKDKQAAQIKSQDELPVAITELPPKSNGDIPIDVQQKKKPPIPITELQPKSKIKSLETHKQENTKSAEDK